jgi:hypothetical protein
MLRYKSWIDTRSRFLLGLGILLVFACGTAMSFQFVQKLTASVEGLALQPELQESLELIRTFPGYAWSQWFSGNFPALLTFFAALLGSGNPLVKSGSGALFSLALPVSRGRWIFARAETGLAELFVLALAPALVIAALAPLVDGQLAVIDAVVYGLCAFVVASLFFAVAVFLSTLFNDVWRPLLLTCFVAIALAAAGTALPETQGLFEAMAGQSYFYDGVLPWFPLLLSGAGAAALIYAAAANVARRDF